LADLEKAFNVPHPFKQDMASGSDEILLPDKLEEGDESPYRRRQKPLRVRRHFSQNLGRILRWSLIGLVILAPLAYGTFRLIRYLRDSPRFEIRSARDVVVEGDQYVSPDEVMNALGLPSTDARYGVNIFRLSLDEMRSRVESISWVKSATLTRAFPHRLIVRLVERTPVAFVNVGGQVKLVDGDGMILEKPEHGTFAFPVIEGLEAASDTTDRRARMALFQTFQRQMSDQVAASGWIVSEVDLSDADDLKAVLVQGEDTILVHFGRQGFAERFHDFLVLIPEMRKNNARIYSVDLRYRNQVVVNPQRSSSSKQETPARPAAHQE
jgi:cell division protein FtsQ